MRIRIGEQVQNSLPILILSALWLVFFWPMLTGNWVCGFRDSAYLYYPLFQWVDQVWANGEWPLWNPYDGAGIPVVGDGSSAVFYPGKLVFLLRWLSFPTRYGWFLASHVWLASLGAYWLSRQFGQGRFASAIAGLSYGFGGPLLTQVSNCIYLIGGVWLPFALGSIWNLYRTESWKWVFLLSGCLTMLFLGGDPQTAYHVLLIAAICIAFVVATRIRVWVRVASLLRLRSELTEDEPTHDLNVRALGRLIFKLGTGVCLAILCSSIQLLPTWEWSKLSERQLYSSPRNIYELASGSEGRLDEILGPPSANSHHQDLYEFSLPPWTLYELLVPNGGGKMYPVNARFIDALPGADRVWYPSLYMGVLTLLLACYGMRLGGHDKLRSGLTWLAILFTLGSFGWYGVPWLLKESNVAACEEWGSQVGGVYWFFVTFLPNYVLFRYPAKLFLMASLMLALLAARTTDSLLESRDRAVGLSVSSDRLFWLAFGSGLLLGIFGVVILASQVMGVLSAERLGWSTANEFGPCDIDLGLRQLGFGLLQSSAILLVGSCLIWNRDKLPFQRRVFPCLLLIVISADLCFANRWILADVHHEFFRVGDDVASFAEGDIAPERMKEERREPATTPLEQTVQGYYRNLVPKTHLLAGLVAYDSFASIESVWGTSLTEQELAVPAIDLRETPFNKPVMIRDGKLIYGEDVALAPQGSERGAGVKRGSWSVDRWDTAEIEISVAGVEGDATYLCLRQTWVPGWQARIESEDFGPLTEEVEPWLGQFQTIKLPSGNCTVTLSYRPVSFTIGFWLSLTGLVTFVIAGTFSMLPSRSVQRINHQQHDS